MRTTIVLALILATSSAQAQTSQLAETSLSSYNSCVQQANASISEYCSTVGPFQIVYPHAYVSYSYKDQNPNLAYWTVFACPVVRPDLPGGFDFFGFPFVQCPFPNAALNFTPISILDSSHDIFSQPKNPSCKKGSIISLDSRSVGEQIAISGQDYALNYTTQFDPARSAGRKIKLELSFEGTYQVPRSLVLVGKNSPIKRFEYPAIGAISFDYIWDPQDLISPSPFVDSEDFDLKVVSPYASLAPSELPSCAIGTMGSSPTANCASTDNIPRIKGDSSITQRRYKLASYKPSVWGLGGWTLTNHHYYDNIAKIIYFGYGQSKSIEGIPRTLSPYGVVNFVAAQDSSEVYIFDSLGRHVETRTALLGAIKYRFIYLSDHKLDQIIDRSNLVTRVLRDSQGDPTGIQNPFGVITQLEVNSSGKLSEINSASGAITEIQYLGGNGLLSQIRYPSGLVTDFTHTSDGLFIDERKNTGGFQILSESFESLKKTIGFQTAEGVASKTVDDRSNVLSPIYSSLDFEDKILQRSTLTNGGTMEVIDQPTYQIRNTYRDDVRFGNQVQFASDVFERETLNAAFFRLVAANQEVTYLQGEGPFNIDKLTTTSNIQLPATVQKQVFDGSERSFSLIQDDVLQSKIFFDQSERISHLQSPGALDLELSYNNFGQLAQVKQGKSVSSYFYSEKGFLLQERDAQNRMTSYLRDDEGKVLEKTLPNGDKIAFDYTSSGALRKIRTPNGEEHNFNQTLLDQVSAYLPPVFASENGQSVYTYDLDGRLKTITKAGRIATFYYKAGTNFIERIATPEGDYLFQDIDARGRFGLAFSPDGIRTENRYVEDEIVINNWAELSTGQSGQITYNLNSLRQVASVVLNNSSSVIFEYDQLGRIVRAGDERYTYTTSNQSVMGSDGLPGKIAEQRVVSVLAGNLTSTSRIESSDVAGRDPTNRTIQMQIAMSGGSLNVETSESVDSVGNIAVSARKSLKVNGQVKGDDLSQYFIYDSNNRLVRIDEEERHNLNGQISQVPRRPTAEYVFGAGSNNNIRSYEHFGKLTSAVYGPQDRLLKLQGAIQRDFEYSADGTLSKISNCLGEKKFEYDFFGNLKKVTLPDGKVITYKHDVYNRRVLKLINGINAEKYTWYDQTRLATVDRGGERITYIYGSHPIAPSYVLIGPFRYKVVPTWKGDIRYIVAEDGTVVQEITYDEYGNTLKDTSIGRVVGGQVINTPIQPLGFVSGLTDWDTKMIRFGARDYDPVVGRWTAKDPIGFAGGDTNLYSYVGQNPLNYVDPSGLKCTLSQSTGQLNCVNDISKDVYIDTVGYSGTGAGRNNPAQQGVPFVGPIPRGTYRVGPPGFLPTSGTPGRLLTPISVQCPSGRDCNSFYIHGDNSQNDASNGCPIINKGQGRDKIPTGEIFEVVQ